jgi:MerR family transcriptional regulator, mercuric resistance operon regulatory protein
MIGRLVKAAEVNVETIRYYQRRRLQIEPPKPLGSQRRYQQDAVMRVRFIKRARRLGFTLRRSRTCCCWRMGKIASQHAA